MFKQLAILSTLITNLTYGMNCSEFNSFAEHDGHYYTITHDKLTFANAQTYATSNNGYLAIPNNDAENTFLSSIITRDAAWIGIHDPNFIQNQCSMDEGNTCIQDDTRFRTVKMTPLSFRNWNSGEPNNAVYNTDFLNGNALVSPIGEYWVVMGAAGKWVDVGNHISGNAQTARYQALIEFDAMPECATPSTDNTDIVDQLGAGGQAVCDTKIYNPELNITLPHQTFDCQSDANGTQYCPFLLAECGQEWDYYPADSQEHNNTYFEYVDATIQNIPIPPIGISFVRQWWWCNTCNYATNMLQTVLPVIEAAGGTYIEAEYSGNFYDAYYTVSHDATKDFFIRLNGGDPIRIKPGEPFTMFYKWFKNSDGVKISAGGKPDVYFSTSKQCQNLQLIRRTKDYPEHYACIDSNNEDIICPDGSTQDNINGNLACFGEDIVRFCPDGYLDENNTCVKSVDYTYYEYLCKNGGQAINSGGDCAGEDLVDTDGDGIGDSCNSQLPPDNNCRQEKFICQSDEERPCVKVDNKMQCSPFPCFGTGDIESLDTPVGLEDKNNDGWTESGDCAGQLYIFNGQDNRCRSKMAFGLVDDCCSHDAFLLSLIECKDYEQILDHKKEDDRCHYIGDYCSDKVLWSCVQRKKTYCCFNSTLARIIVEEGRDQLKNVEWGTSKSPNCRGFTPEEFEKLDFSRIDLTEFTDDIQSQINTTNIQNTADRLKDKINNMQGATP